MMESNIENITPEIAKEYLKHNIKNRKVKPKTVEAYARDIIRGKFATTHQGIAFDENGDLLDGQHRLLAIVMSDRPVTMMVTRGMPRDTICSVDRGITRSVRDVFSIEYEGANIDSNVITNQKIISGLSQLAACNYATSSMKLSTEDIRRLYEDFQAPVESVYNNIVSKIRASIRSPMLSAAIAAIQCGVSVDAVSKFFYIFFKDDVSGCDNYNIQAVLNWKRQIDTAKMNKVSINSKKLYLGTQNAIYHFVNNTKVCKVVAPADYRYNVYEKIKHALDVA